MSDEQSEQTVTLEELERINPEDDLAQVRVGALDERLAAMYGQLLAKFPKYHYGTKGSGSNAQTYIDARSVMERLDQVFGWDKWQPEFHVIDPRTCAVECVIHVILPDGRSIAKSDVGYPNNESVEGRSVKNASGKVVGSGMPLKDAFSDSLKRAAVHYGIGRHLYPYPGAKNMTRDEVDKKAAAAAEKAAPKAETPKAAPQTETPKAASAPAAPPTWSQVVDLAKHKAGDGDVKDYLKQVMKTLHISVANSNQLKPEQLQRIYDELAA